jgi:hypothetical protein
MKTDTGGTPPTEKRETGMTMSASLITTSGHTVAEEAAATPAL